MQLIMENLGVTFKNEKERSEFLQDRRHNHAQLQKEINIPFSVDRDCWEYKTITEKVAKANMKRKWNR